MRASRGLSTSEVERVAVCARGPTLVRGAHDGSRAVAGGGVGAGERCAEARGAVAVDSGRQRMGPGGARANLQSRSASMGCICEPCILLPAPAGMDSCLGRELGVWSGSEFQSLIYTLLPERQGRSSGSSPHTTTAQTDSSRWALHVRCGSAQRPCCGLACAVVVHPERICSHWDP